MRMDEGAKRALVDVVNGLGQPLSRWVRRPRLGAAEIIGKASRLEELEQFGEPQPLEPLGVLFEALERESDLTLVGRLAMRTEALAMLRHRLQMEARRTRYPELAEQPIRAPIFIAGLPRTGTTLLHNLLSLDEQHRSPLTWEVMFPQGVDSKRPAEYWIAAARRRIAQLGWLAPDFKRAHEVNALQPQECVQITGHSFESHMFEVMCRVPGYQRWLDERDLEPSYRLHRRFLQHLQYAPDRAEPPRTWVLKAPAHLFALDALLAVYPDARIVQTHRDPLKVMPSLASLVYSLRRAFSNAPERGVIGAEVLDRWTRALELALQHRRRREAGGASVWVDLHYSDLMADPLQAMERLYKAFGRELTGHTADRIRRFLAESPQHKFGVHRYGPEDFGLSTARLREHFQNYCDAYDLAPENR